MERQTTGIYHKFNVTRVDGAHQPGHKHDGCKYFVLDLTHDKHAPAAMAAYAESCRENYPALAHDCASYAASAGITAERDQLRAEVERLRGEVDDAGAQKVFWESEAIDMRSAMFAATARAEAAEGRAAGLCRALCDTVKASGGVARDGLSDEFLILGVPAEMAARKKAQKAAEHTVAGLRRAGQAVVDRWDSPKWKDQDPTAKVINELRAALAASSDEHARRIKSEALLEMANRLDKQCCECHDECIQDLLEEADRLESEATNG